MLTYIIISVLLAVAPLIVRSERSTNIIAATFFMVQVAAIAAIFHFDLIDSTLLSIFTADTTAVVFHILMTCVLGFALLHSSSYLIA